jgi:hypothetical protein
MTKQQPASTCTQLSCKHLLLVLAEASHLPGTFPYVSPAGSVPTSLTPVAATLPTFVAVMVNVTSPPISTPMREIPVDTATSGFSATGHAAALQDSTPSLNVPLAAVHV